jgi:hypothetical protein
MRRRVLLFAVLSLLLGQAVLSYAAEVLVGCEEKCADDGAGGCNDDEGCCSCCFHPRTTLPAAVALGRLSPGWSDLPPATPAVPLAVPREILHVPKSSLV